MLTELTIKEFINKVLSNDPVPGGGSVSAPVSYTHLTLPTIA